MRNENNLIFEQYKIIKEADEQEQVLNKIREYIKTLEYEDEMPRIVSVYNNIAVWAARANISDETLKTVLSPEDFNLYQHYYPADLKPPHRDITLRQDAHHRARKVNETNIKEYNINPIKPTEENVYKQIVQIINSGNNQKISKLYDAVGLEEERHEILQLPPEEQISYLQGLIHNALEYDPENDWIPTFKEILGITIDRYRLGQDSDIEEANTQQDVKKYIVLLGNGDDNGIFGFKAVYSNKQLALKDIADNKYPADEVEIREVPISSKTPIVVQVFDEEQRHWIFEDIFNDINTAKTELKFFADEDGFPPDVHFSQISVDDPHPDLGTKNYGLKIKYTDSL